MADHKGMRKRIFIFSCDLKHKKKYFRTQGSNAEEHSIEQFYLERI